MRKSQLVFLFLVLGAMLFSSCINEKEPDFGFEDLPEASREFLIKYFPGNDVASVCFEKPFITSGLKEDENNLYVLLEGNTQVIFSKDEGNWLEVFAPDGIPETAAAILDNYVYTRLNNHESDAKITEFMPLFEHSIIIGLDNGRQYAQSQLLEYSGVTLAEVNVIEGNLKSKILSFLEQNPVGSADLTDYIFKITETEGTAYRLFLGDELTISFDKNAEWIHAGTDFIKDNSDEINNFLKSIVKNEMPESISNIIDNQYDLGEILTLASYGNGDYGLRFRSRDLLINENTGIANHLLPVANAMLEKYFGSSYKLLYPHGISYVGAYRFNSTFVYYDGSDFHVSIQVDMHGDWNSVTAAYIKNGKPVYVSLPPEIINELPDAVANYLVENYKENDIFRISQKLFFRNEFSVLIDRTTALYFNEDGSYKTKIESVPQ